MLTDQRGQDEWRKKKRKKDDEYEWRWGVANFTQAVRVYIFKNMHIYKCLQVCTHNLPHIHLHDIETKKKGKKKKEPFIKDSYYFGDLFVLSLIF